MKKNYIIPETKVYEMGAMAMIAASSVVHNEQGDGVQLSVEERTDLGSDNVWNEIW